MWQSYSNGLLVAIGLIMAIGAQNAFVLAQSLRYAHTEAHVRTRLAESGFEALTLVRSTIRMDGGKPVHGILFLAATAMLELSLKPWIQALVW